MNQAELTDLKEDIRDIKESLKDFQTNIYKILNGNGRIGAIAKVNIMWKVFPWILVLLSAAGLIPDEVVARILGK